MLLRRPRSFRMDALRLTSRIAPPPVVQVSGSIPAGEPFLVTINHYTRPGFDAWWLALAVSAALEQDVHWVMTSAWTFPGRWYAGLLRPLSRRVFARLAQIYGFSLTPPMPPDPAESQARAASVRQVLEQARSNPKKVIGLSPEGGDFPGGALGWPPHGVGRFIYQFTRQGYKILPVGIYEEDGTLFVRLGSLYPLSEPHSHANGEINPDTFRLVSQRQVDLLLRRTIMRRIAVLLPARLQGPFTS